MKKADAIKDAMKPNPISLEYNIVNTPAIKRCARPLKVMAAWGENRRSETSKIGVNIRCNPPKKKEPPLRYGFQVRKVGESCSCL